MNEHRRSGWALALGVVLLSIVAGTIAYNVGLSQGLASTAAVQGTAPPPAAYGYGWYRPWGVGFPFFPGLLFVFLWFALLRGLWWGGGCRGRGWYRHDGVPLAFEEWHRQAHERGKESLPADDPGGRGRSTDSRHRV